MEVTIFSREHVKPSKPSLLRNVKPYNLCLFDQFTPFTYPSGVYFYPNVSHPNFNVKQTLAHLKESPSEALNIYYPFSGRVKNNLFVDEFDAGLLYLEAQVNCHMSEYLKKTDTNSLNKFLAFHPFVKETQTESLPLIAFQVNVFICGGIGIGVSLCHKLADATTLMYLLQSWAAIFTDSPNKVIHLNLSGASIAFPPRDLPENHLDLMDELWFKESNFITRRFVFSAGAIATLRDKAKSDRVPKPTRNEALTGFIWKHATSAMAASGSSRISVVAHAVNMRPRIKKPYSLESSIGNIFWWAFAAANPTSDKERELDQLVGQLKEVLESFDTDYLETMQGHDGFSTVSELLSQIEAMYSIESEKPDIIAFTGWNGLFNHIDFGWGKPVWVGVMGKVGPKFRNLVVFIDSQWGKGIEAWITLEEKQMKILEKDMEFLAFASLDPGVSSL